MANSNSLIDYYAVYGMGNPEVSCEEHNGLKDNTNLITDLRILV
jgi:hypothetical protein